MTYKTIKNGKKSSSKATEYRVNKISTNRKPAETVAANDYTNVYIANNILSNDTHHATRGNAVTTDRQGVESGILFKELSLVYDSRS